DLDIKTIRRRARRALLEDGILETLFGLWLVGWGAAMTVRSWVLPFTPFALVFIPVLVAAAQRRFVYPRVGYANLGSPDGRGSRSLVARGAAMLSGMLIAAAAVWIWRLAGASSLGSARVLPVLVGALLALAPFVFAFKYGVTRWHVFAVLFVASGFVMPYLNRSRHYEDVVGMQLEIAGAVLLASGLVLFARFIRKHPVQAMEVDDGER
ncbi:MAG TPA: hypothetical protein VMT60_02120, partial [Candidatus Bathyarchaeia archaeon]|nr:hypothetical protein [Candidatus Bathyarchaeia archaeon]